MKPIEDQSLFRACKILVLCGGMWRGNIPNWPIAHQKLYKVFLRGAQFAYFFCLPSLILSLWVNVDQDNEKAISVLKNITFVVVIFCKMIIIQSRPVTMLIEAASEKEHRRHVVYTEFVVKSIMLCTFLAGLAYVVGDLYLANEFYKLHPNAAPTDPKPHSIYFWFPFNPDEYYKIALTYEFVHIVQTVIYNGASHAVVNSEDSVSQLINEQICSTSETFGAWDASSIAVATLFCLVLLLVILCTFYEVFLHQRKTKNSSPLLTAFSVFNNGRKLTGTTQQTANSDQILSFHGIKVISMMWIIAGHAAGAFTFLPVTNRREVEEFESERYAQYLTTAHLAVDTFFFISGFLLAYQITPVVLMFFLYSVYLSKHVGNGPIFPLVYDTFNNPCKKHWWAVFLYIQNYYNRDEICWVHLWYLSADWQLFLAAPLVLIPMAWLLKRGFKLVFTAMAILNVFFVLLAIFVKLVFPNFDPEHLEYDAHSKLVTYFMGAMFGICLRCHLNKPYVFRRGCNLIMWAISLSMLFAATLVLHEVNINHIESHTVKSITDVLIKPFWALGLAFVIYACTSGYGGIVNWLLTAGWMQVLSKLKFCMYITHCQ
ncbi:hypothetical protein HUJ04_009155 [Dendroctonus ponderosae]|nr:hypothetical protein HUJ04_009155 [Dendroctonus ponderosae]